MTATRIPLPLLVVGIVLLAGGCSTRVREVDSTPDFAVRLAAAPAVGAAVVTVDPAVTGILSDADQADADDALYGALLAAERGLEVWHPGTVRQLAGSAALDALAAEYTRYGRLRADQLTPLAVPLEGCRFLAFGRLTEERVRTQAQSQTTSDPEARAEGLAEHGDPMSTIASVERQVRVSVELFDLVSGESAWRGEGTSKQSQLYEYDAEAGTDTGAYLQRRLAAPDDEQVLLSRRGEALKLPDLVELMRRAFTELAGSLPAAGS